MALKVNSLVIRINTGTNRKIFSPSAPLEFFLLVRKFAEKKNSWRYLKSCNLFAIKKDCLIQSHKFISGYEKYFKVFFEVIFIH